MLGVKETVGLMEQLGLTLPPWVQTMLKQGNTSFYRTQDGRELVYNPTSQSYEPVRMDPESISLEALRQASETSYYKGNGSLWVKLVSSGDVLGSGPNSGPSGGASLQVSR